MARFDDGWFLELHREMFGDVWTWAGTLRRTDLNVGLPAHRLPEAMANLVADLAYWETNWSSVLEQSVHLHVQAVKVHPFLNGNGRWSRMLQNIWLMRHHHPICEWPDSLNLVESPARSDYIRCIKLAVNDGDFGPVTNICKKFLSLD